METDFFDRLIGRGVRISTAKKYCGDIIALEKWMGKDVDEFTRKDYNQICLRLRGQMPKNRWKDSDKPENYGANTMKAYLHSLKAYYKAYELVDEVEWISVPKKNTPKRAKPFIHDTSDFLEKVWGDPLPNVKNHFVVIRAKMMVVFGYFFAARRSEIPIVLDTDINWEKQTVSIEDIKGGSGKYEEPQSDPIFWRYLKEYLRVRDENVPYAEYVFCSTGGRKIGIFPVTQAFKMFTPILKELGVEGVGFSPHIMRRSRATKVAGRTSTRKGMYITRHKSIAVYQKYLDLDLTEDLKEEMMEDGTLSI